MMLDAALKYHDDGLCVIPVKPRDKRPALPSWEEYQFRLSTETEIRSWWANMPDANIGIVCGPGNTIELDIDHDKGALQQIKDRFPRIGGGRIVLSGSGEGYHIPLRVGEMPELGHDFSLDRPRGNRTWNTPYGAVNIRARWCQTVAPPSIHPSGNPYTYAQAGEISTVENVEPLIQWLSQFDPRSARSVKRRDRPAGNGESPLRAYFRSILEAADALGIVGERCPTPDGQVRITNHGGLLINEDEGKWYCFSDEIGGDAIDLFGWVEYGTSWDRYDRAQFYKVARKMEAIAGIGQVREPVRFAKVAPLPVYNTPGYWR